MKKKAHIKFKSSFNICDYRKFSLLRVRTCFKYESKKCFHDYTKRIENSLESNQYNYQKYIKNNRFISKVPKELSYNGVTSINEQKAVELLSAYFYSVFSKERFDLYSSKLGISELDLP